jgi:hypothetical protein
MLDEVEVTFMAFSTFVLLGKVEFLKPNMFYSFKLRTLKCCSNALDVVFLYLKVLKWRDVKFVPEHL